MNKVLLIGNITRDPETRFTKDGKPITDFGLALKGFGDKTVFVDVKTFGKTAETVGQHKKKGDPVAIDGRLELDTWEDKASGQKRSKLYVVAENVEFLSKREGGEAKATASETPEEEQKEESDIPF